MSVIPKFRAWPADSAECVLPANRINNRLEMDTITSSKSSLSLQFCAFCLREKLPDTEFFKHVVGCSVEQQKCLQSILRYDFRLQNFAICKPCWKIMQLIQDFRLRCLKANSLAERVDRGVSSEDGWFSVRILATIESVRMAVKDQLLQMEKVEAELMEQSKRDQQNETREASEEVLVSTLDIGEVKVELNGAEGGKGTDERSEINHTGKHSPMVTIHDVQIKSEPDVGNKSQCDNEEKSPGNSAEEILKSRTDLSNVKIEPEEVTKQPSSNKTNETVSESDSKELNASAASNQTDNRDSPKEVLESAIDIGEVKIEPEVEDKEPPSSTHSDKMETESDDDSAEHSTDDPASSNQKDTSGLHQCKKCSRMFESTGYKLHIQICDGTIPNRIYKCPHCPITFGHLYKLNAHVNKHTGKTPFECRKHCKKGFASAAVRNRHEARCGKDFKKCTLCDKTLENQMRLYEHYRLEHPGEKRYPCSRCDARFKNREQLLRHEKTHAPGDSAKRFSCKECDKSFAENYNLKKHMATHTERKPIQCEHCDKQFKIRESLELHKAAKHPEVATESAKRNLVRSKERYREISSKRKLEPRVLKKRGRKPTKKKKESETEAETESDTEISEDYSEESDTE